MPSRSGIPDVYGSVEIASRNRAAVRVESYSRDETTGRSQLMQYCPRFGIPESHRAVPTPARKRAGWAECQV